MKTGRNDPCPCGSGKKYKKCCLEKHLAEARREAEVAVRAAEEARRQAEDETRTAAMEAQPDQAMAGQPRELEEEDRSDLPEAAWPPLSEDDQRVVKAWWKEVGPVYVGKTREARIDWLLDQVNGFLDQHPVLFRYLYLHEEFLFEVGATLARLGRTDAYVGLLKRLARDQPEMYLCCFGYYDLDIIADLIRTGDRASIPTYMDRFKQYPDGAAGQLQELMSLLAWRGLEAELGELINAPAIRKAGYADDWLSHQAMVPFLEAGDTSPEAQEKLRGTLLPLRCWSADELEPESLARILRVATLAPAHAGLDLSCDGTRGFHALVGWSFAGWLRRQGMNWTAARYAADRLNGYWARADLKPHGGRFGLDGQRLDHYLAQTCRDFFWLEGVYALATIQAMVWFTDYLAENGFLSELDAHRLQTDFEGVHKRAMPAIDVNDPARCICPSFASLVMRPGQFPGSHSISPGGT